MIDFLRELVILSSETGDIDGVFAVQKKLYDHLSVLGAHQFWIEPEKTGFAPALLASWGERSRPGICLVSHADTVYSSNSLQPFQIDENQGYAYGGGVADNKGGLVVAFSALEKLFAQGLLRNPKRPLYLFSSSCEELGSPAFQNYIRGFSEKLEYVFGMEPALPDGSLIKKRRGNRYYILRILGNSVHTGRDARVAANPVEGLVLLHQIVKELKAKHAKLSISLNGLRSTPFKFNMSSEKIEVTLDLRFDQAADAAAFHEDFTRRVGELKFHSDDGKRKGSLEWELVDDCPAFESKVDESLQKISEIYSRYEGQPVAMGDGRGASDCCYFHRPGLKIVDGLGPRGGRIHSPEEYIEISSLEKRASALSDYLAWLLMK